MSLDRTIEGLKAALALAASILLVVYLFQSGGRSNPPGRLVAGEPTQSSTGPLTWRKNGYTISSLARYRIEALVISTERYWFDGGADLSPLDFAVGWGPMSDQAVLNKLR